MTLLQLKYIAMIAKCGSFSRAAQTLYVTQPGISKMVRAVEEELGITIFVRSSAGITLTAEGLSTAVHYTLRLGFLVRTRSRSISSRRSAIPMRS